MTLSPAAGNKCSPPPSASRPGPRRELRLHSPARGGEGKTPPTPPFTPPSPATHPPVSAPESTQSSSPPGCFSMAAAGEVRGTEGGGGGGGAPCPPSRCLFAAPPGTRGSAGRRPPRPGGRTRSSGPASPPCPRAGRAPSPPLPLCRRGGSPLWRGRGRGTACLPRPPPNTRSPVPQGKKKKKPTRCLSATGADRPPRPGARILGTTSAPPL